MPAGSVLEAQTAHQFIKGLREAFLGHPKGPSFNDLLVLLAAYRQLPAAEQAAVQSDLTRHTYTYSHWAAYQSLLYYMTQNSDHWETLARSALRYSDSLGVFHNFIWQVRSRLFRDGTHFSYAQRNRIQDEILRPAYNQVVDTLKPLVDALYSFSYQPSIAPQRVAILTPQFTIPSHSPSRQCLAIASELLKLGLEVHIVNANILPLSNPLNVVDAFVANVNEDLKGHQSLCVDYLDEKLVLWFYSLTPREFSVVHAVEVLAYLDKMGIDAVICCGELLLIQDFIFGKVPSLYSTLGGTFPFSQHDYYWLWGQPNEKEYLLQYAQTHGIGQRTLATDQHRTRFDFEFGVHILPDADHAVTRAQFNIPQHKFVYLIAGLRLHRELDDDFLAICRQLLEKDNVFLLFVGRELALEDYFGQLATADNCLSLPSQDAFREIVGLCDAFLNPFREGGATGGSIALQQQVPVLTLADNHNGSLVGPQAAFTCRTTFAQAVLRVCDDPSYARQLWECGYQHAFAQNNATTVRQMLDRLVEVGQHFYGG